MVMISSRNVRYSCSLQGQSKAILFANRQGHQSMFSSDILTAAHCRTRGCARCPNTSPVSCVLRFLCVDSAFLLRWTLVSSSSLLHIPTVLSLRCPSFRSAICVTSKTDSVCSLACLISLPSLSWPVLLGNPAIFLHLSVLVTYRFYLQSASFFLADSFLFSVISLTSVHSAAHVRSVFY